MRIYFIDPIQIPNTVIEMNCFFLLHKYMIRTDTGMSNKHNCTEETNMQINAYKKKNKIILE